MNALLESPAVLVVAAMAIAGAFFALRRARAGASARGGEIPGMDALLAKGRYEDAASLALEHERPREAIELLLRGQHTARAAALAARIGDLRLAAELYARAEDWERAAACYEKAGLPGPAQEARAKVRGAQQGVAASAERRAQDAEAKVRAAQARGDELARAEAQTLAQRAAAEHLAAGDIERAARVYRDGGLLDEAIHLYANVLGLPGDAAPLVAELGNPERAAELYEIAGMRERAAQQWAELARGHKHPENFLRRVIALDADAAFGLLEELVRARPLSEGSVEIHYHFAVMLSERGERERAEALLTSIRDGAGGFRDVEARLRALRAPMSPTPPRSGAEQVTVVVQPVVVGDGEAIDFERIGREAAQAAAQRAQRSSMRPPDALPPTRVNVEVNPAVASTVFATGIEERPISLALLADSAVRAAREGPSVATLARFVEGRACDLGTIEVFYRLGLAHLAGGDFASALRCFEQVEEASPGYRDASERASEVRGWRAAMGKKLSLAGGAGSTDGRYALRGEIGRGGMAVVYRAVDTVLDREVALKFLNEESSASAELREMFQREARSVAQLNHPNIVTVYDFGTLEGRAFIAMEFVEGVTVEQLIQSERRMPVIEALRVTQQVLSALEYAHQRSIIHRDVKPSNMMRTSSGVVKLMDFGLAKSIAQGAKASIVAGTPAYMPPEQFVGQRVDHRADLFAVAASLYEMLTGALPFATFDRSVRPQAIRAVHPEVPELVERVVGIGLDPDPARRFQSAGDFAAPLRRVLGAIERGSLRPGASASEPAPEVIPTLPPPSPSLASLVPQEEAPSAAQPNAKGTVRFGAPR